MDSTKNDHQKQKESKEKLFPSHRSQRLSISIHKDEYNDTNDQIPHISYHHVKYFYEKLPYSGQSCLRELYLKLKKIFEGSSEGIGDLASATHDEDIPNLNSDTIVEEIGELPSATPVVSNYEEPIHPYSLE